MGTIACCKKPNEMVEDQDVFKKSTIKKTMNFQVEQIDQEQERQNPFQKANSRQNNNNINEENTNNNKVLDLEETKKTNNIQYIHQIEHQIDHQATNGPSDNLRKKNIKKQILTNNNSNNINSTMNTSEQTQVRTNSKFFNKDNNINEQIKTINDNIRNDNAIKEKEPTDKISINNNKQNQDRINLKENIMDNNITNINNINMITKNNITPEREPLNNSEKIPSDSERIHEKKNEPLNSQNINNQIKDEPQNNNIKIREIEEKNMILKDDEQMIEERNINMIQKIPQDQYEQKQLNIEENIKLNINNNMNNLENINEEPQNSPDKSNLNINNIIENNNNITNNEQNYIPQNIIKNHTKIDSQLQDEDDPKDSNEINPTHTMNNQEQTIPKNTEKEQEENSEIKEAYIQDPDGQIIPTQQISDSEIAYLYQQCLSKGETEPDDDFTIESYKKFYPEDDPFFLFDKGEVSEGQIISSPDELESLEIYEGEINDQNKKHGFGILTTPEFVRRGTWRNGEFTGWGRESRRNKEVLEGKFIDGTLNGKGIYKKSNNSLYTGDFVNSLREGFGELYTNRIHYIGEFKENKLNGKGIIEFLKEGHKYEGDFKNNEINGRGIFQWKNGDIYEGDMTEGKMNGKGIYKYANGQIYEGEYINGIREGKGRIISNNKVVFEGDFIGGHRVIKGRTTSSNRLTNNENLDTNNKIVPNN